MKWYNIPETLRQTKDYEYMSSFEGEGEKS
jgi:hypothetical protein